MKNRDIEKNIICWGSGKSDCGCAGHCPYWIKYEENTTQDRLNIDNIYK